MKVAVCVEYGSNSILCNKLLEGLETVFRILGITPTLDGMKIDPCLPKEIGAFRTARKIGDTTLLISGKRGGNYSLSVDGKAVEGKTVKLEKGRIMNIEVTDL